MRGRAPLHAGHGHGLSQHYIGQFGGAELVPLTLLQMPGHNHFINVAKTATTGNPIDKVPAASTTHLFADRSPGDTKHLAADAVTNTGNGDPHANMQPYLAVNFIISLDGEYPPRE